MEKRVNNGSEYPVQSEVVLGRPPKEGVPEVKVKLHRSTRKKFLGKITRSSEVADFIRSIFKRGEIQVQEQFIVLYLNRSNQILGYYKHSIGGISGTLADVRLILSTALKTTSVAIILAHNHPSSNTQPSEADKKITQKIANAAKLMDISVLDHVIITKDSYYSFADEGLMGLDGIEGIKTSPSNNEKTTFVHIVESDLKEKRKRNKRDYEKLAAHYGITDRTLVKELTEFAIVNVARKIAHSPGTVKERFNKIVELYNRQVNLSHRTSQSILLQQYSTPAPIGYLAGIFCGIDQKGYYFEPSAGNGLLTIAGSPENFVVNEIDTVRNENLQKQGFDKVFSIDATQDFVLSNHTTFFQNVKFDAVITNPPFGRLDTPIHYENYPIHDLDHLMVLRSLDLMKDNGKAAIIIGGHSKWDEKGRIRRGKNRILFNYLFSRYHVADVIQVDGKKLYSRQGTAFPVRLILIDGRKANPKGAAPIYDKQEDKVVSTFNELYERVMDAMDHKENKIQISKDVYQAKLIKRYRQLKEKHPNPILLLRQSELYYVFEDDAIRVSKITGSVLTKLKDAKGKMIFATTLNPFEAAERHLKEITRQGYKVALADELQSPDSLKSKALTLKNKLLGNDGLAGPYNPGSDACVVLHTQVPDSMDFETHEAINQIRKAVGGDFDEFVKQRLGYHNQKELCAALAAEQIDAVALAIYNIEARGQGTIIGDQTGIGKGRIAAAMIRYAVQRGKQPIFLTEKANLFSDIYRDLKAIGSANLVPFILNSRESKTNIKNEDGQIIYQAPEPEEQQRILRDQKLPSTYDFNIATYSQVNSPEKKPLKPLYLAANAKGNIMVMDESHNASGSSNTGSYLRAIAGDTDGMVFLSATFAKRPENLAIYAMKTAISEANMTTDELVDAISKGGVAMQEILASQLVREGQMLRRERSFEGVKVNYEIMDSQALEHRAIADNITEILREIISFQANGIKKKVDEIDEIVKAEGKEVKERGGTTRLGVDNQPVFSKVFNLVHQMLFALKAETVAEKAIMRLKEGKKPVIAFASTMGSFIENMQNERGLQVQDGDIINADFSEVLRRALDGVFRYTVYNADGEKELKRFDILDFPKDVQDEYYRIDKKIKEATTGITISPIDVIIQKLEGAGYSVAEVTGRKLRVKLNTVTGMGMIKSRKKINANDAFRQFNNNETDVLLINQSGSTGASAHAIPTAKVPKEDVKPRVMIVLQAELDINTEVQKRGRINRTGQILKPEYDYLSSAIPAEQRLMMMLQKKLKSLDANTSSNQKQSSRILDVPDFLNKYGDIVVAEYLKDNLEVNDLLDDPLGLKESGEGDTERKPDAAHMVSGRVAVLSTDMQQEFYNDVTTRYNEYVEYLKQVGDYDLEVEDMNLQTETLERKTVIVGKDGQSAFSEDSVLETVEANVLKKPFSRKELNNLISEALDNKDQKEQQQEIVADFQQFIEARHAENVEKEKARYEELIANVPNEKKVQKALEEGGVGAQEILIEQRTKELLEAETKALTSLENKHNNLKNYLGGVFKFFYVGKNLQYPIQSFDAGAVQVPAVFLGFVIDQKKKNPYAPSAVKLRIALANSHKYIAIPASFHKDVNGIKGASATLQEKTGEQILDDWEKAIQRSTVDRQTRFIITGNLLQAFSQFTGKLISYTTMKGEVQKGILMPEYWTPQEETNRNVSVPIIKATKIIKSLAINAGIYTNNEIALFRNSNGYKIIVPASRKKGGGVYLDEDILKLAENNNFEKTANKMVAFLDFSRIEEFIKVLQKKYNPSVTISAFQYDTIKDEKGDRKRTWPRILITPVADKPSTTSHNLLKLRARALKLKLQLLAA